jgi:hypothetical protein
MNTTSLEEITIMTDIYFTESVDDDGISGDDVNRRLRERRLGFKAPSDDWHLAGAPIHCIYKGQIPTRNLHDVVLYNFLPLAVIGFIATDDFGPVVPGETPGCTVEDDVDNEGMPAPEPACLDCTYKLLGSEDEPCDGCFDCNEFKPSLIEVPRVVEPENCGTSEDDDDVEACENCLHVRCSLAQYPCDGCFDANEWELMIPAEDSDKPTPCADQAESLYRAGCWVALENRKHDLMSEWSLLAANCSHLSCGSDPDGDNDPCCTKTTGNIMNECSFEECPRLNA